MIKINIPFMYAYFPLMNKQLEASKFEYLLNGLKNFKIFKYILCLSFRAS